ncbi:hypothetical protein fHeYen902_299 [Yersinia phage fHe-Yen9-02]|nr:hypothetical protein fHeYen902_299 [Yersinia phage fHe-Yen9-02]
MTEPKVKRNNRGRFESIAEAKAPVAQQEQDSLATADPAQDSLDHAEPDPAMPSQAQRMVDSCRNLTRICIVISAALYDCGLLPTDDLYESLKGESDVCEDEDAAPSLMADVSNTILNSLREGATAYNCRAMTVIEGNAVPAMNFAVLISMLSRQQDLETAYGESYKENLIQNMPMPLVGQDMVLRSFDEIRDNVATAAYTLFGVQVNPDSVADQDFTPRENVSDANENVITILDTTATLLRTDIIRNINMHFGVECPGVV